MGRNTLGETNVPAGLSNVVAIAAGGNPLTGSAYSLALKADNTVVAWGSGPVLSPISGLSNVIAIAGGTDHGLAIRSGPRTPVITLCPVDQAELVGGDVTFKARGAGLYSVAYQWQFEGVDIAGATNTMLALTNVQAGHEGVYNVIVSNEVGSIASPDVTFKLVTPPIIISQTPLPTNQVAVFQEGLTLAVMATAPGQANGFLLAYQWKFNGTNINGGTRSSYTLLGGPSSEGIFSVTITNVAGGTNASWEVSWTFTGSYIDVGTLAYHLSTNAVGRAAGFSGSPDDMIPLSGWSPVFLRIQICTF